MDALIDNAGLILRGFGTTLLLTVVSAVLSLLLGTVLATLRVSPVAPLRAVGTVYVEVFRNTPLTLLFFFFVFVFSTAFFPIGSFVVMAVVALTLYTSAFVCEAVRSGINSVGTGQAEAARAVGMTFTQTLGLIVLPQALRTVVPPLINVFIALAKNTSVAGGFAVTELYAVSAQLANANPADVITVLLGVALCYLVITIPAGQLAGHLERKVAFAR
ncbi:amino acid ABC transporter permease [Desertihabitans brevis]|uniref:Amino acid ABC transporter permease n=1 Tax=Desertihabitans brevis TaxID=2268447 RepID=A0A367YZR2_9ACTN|nr:amino acid ABC transporter permease [Desertihabitans brevis]RCK71395.1 amino acid ABC transporter permease [Desertihabitans brevis]